jgi:tetratricopeptide (TPR) repeat protein
MDVDKAFESIRDNIKNENYKAVRPEIDSIVAANPNDAEIILKCASLLKTIDDEEGCQSLVDDALKALPSDGSKDFDVALAVRGLGRPIEAYSLMKKFKDDKDRMSEVARTMLLADEAEEALELVNKISEPTIRDRLLRCDILCSLGEFNEALKESESIVEDDKASYSSLVNMCTVLMKMGREKDAVKLAKSHLKEDKKNPDSLALNAYVMWINGKIPAAANYANRALHIDYSHVGALEVMAMCFVEKGKYTQAKLFAGAINEKEPGSPAVIRILDACRVSNA